MLIQNSVVELHAINKRKITYPNLPSDKTLRMWLDDVLSHLSDLPYLSYKRDGGNDFAVSTAPSLFFQNALSNFINHSKDRSLLLVLIHKAKNLLS